MMAPGKSSVMLVTTRDAGGKSARDRADGAIDIVAARVDVSVHRSEDRLCVGSDEWHRTDLLHEP